MNKSNPIIDGIRHGVLHFADEMEQKLQKNDHKGGWDKCQNRYLIRRLKEEVKELETACENKNFQKVAEEAIDVGNFAMMVFDRNCWRKDKKS